MIELLNMDCMDYLRECDDNAFQLAIVDPPYGIKNKCTLDRVLKYGQTKTVNDVGVNKKYFSELKRVSENQIIWGGNYFELPYCRGFIFWYKHQPVKTYADGEYAWTSFDRNAQCFDHPYFGAINADKVRIHPTQKPVKLYEWLLTNYAKEGDRILDTHGGSMSSAIACHNLNHDMTIIELDEDYFRAGKERLEAHQQQLRFNI